MIDDFFQQKPSSTDPISKKGSSFLFRSFFYSILLGFVVGFAFGFLYLKGWIPNAEDGLIAYSVTFGIGAILSISIALYQSKINQLKTEKIKKSRPRE